MPLTKLLSQRLVRLAAEVAGAALEADIVNALDSFMRTFNQIQARATIVHEPSRRASGSRPHKARLAAWLCFISCLGVTTSSQGAEARSPEYRTVRINNTQPRRDVAGDIIDAHDGCLQFVNGRYYLYGTAYGKSAGYGINNRFRVYSSPDLERWRFEGELLKSPPDGVYYRPYVAYNLKTHKYVLWYNWYPQTVGRSGGGCGQRYSRRPVHDCDPKVELTQAADRPGDGSLFVDEDGAGYFAYTVIGQDHAVRIERLTPDFLGSSGQVGDVLARGCEAPSMFKRAGLYYALFDATCCFCPAGSGARVFTASAPLGPLLGEAQH